jgi:hypothetical protein
MTIMAVLFCFVASAQYQPSGSKVRYVNGIGLGTKSDAAFGTVDSLVLYAKADSTLMFKYKGTARALAFASDLSIYKLANDSSYNTGWTSRLQSKRLIDSLAATKQSLFTQGLNGYIPKWTSASGLDTSQIRQEGGNILIGGAPNTGPKFHLLGTLKVTGDGGISGALAVTSRVMVGGATDDGLTSLQVNGNAIIKGGGNIYINTTKTNTPDPSNLVGNIAGSGGYWAIRTATDNSFNIDTYNSGSALNAVKVEQDGIVTLANRIKSTQYRLSALNTAPSSASDTGTLGEIRIDANYIYICTSTNTWKRVAIATW